MGMTEREEDEVMKWFKDKPVIVFGNSSYKNNWIDIDNYKVDIWPQNIFLNAVIRKLQILE